MGPKKSAGSVVAKAKKERDDVWAGHQHHDVQRQIENALFTRYYRDLQHICQPSTLKEGDTEATAFEAFLQDMRTPLPTTLWINDTDALAPQISAFFSSFVESGVVAPIPWYPLPGMAWRINADKTALRKDPSPQMQELRQFLIRQTAMGTISRQEEVSMIPTFLLDIKATDTCLDMCASPGSKTAQMLVALGRQKAVPLASDASPFPFDYLSEGLVMANELDYKRANMLVHQVKRMRLLFPFAVFTNHDARYFPEILKDEQADSTPMRFDKILCDVVCSGDGTLRKAPHMFRSWNPREALKIQKTQVHIALRAAHLLKVGGRMVYSTCSLNPIENEAAVSQIMRRTKGALRLVDARALLPGLSCDPGLKTWVVTSAKGVVIDEPNAEYNEAFFPLRDAPEGFDLSLCMRFMPRHCNGGGFFVAVFDKVGEYSIVKRAAAAAETAPSAESGAVAEDDGIPADEPPAVIEGKVKIPPQFVPAPARMTETIAKFYEVPNFPVDNLVCRLPMHERDHSLCDNTTAALVSTSVLRVLRHKSEKLIVVSAGLRTLAHEALANGWRISSEAAPLFTKLMTQNGARRVLRLTIKDIKIMIANGRLKDVQIPDIEDAELRAKVEGLDVGAVLAIVEAPNAPDGQITTMAMRARSRLQLLVDAEDLVALQLRLNISVDTPLAAAEAGGDDEGAQAVEGE